jgi:hypothetical protein
MRTFCDDVEDINLCLTLRKATVQMVLNAELGEVAFLESNIGEGWDCCHFAFILR